MSDFTAQECKIKAVETMQHRASRLASLRGRRLSSEDWQEGKHLLMEAQVWATLATVPEPLEEVHGQLIESSTYGPIIPIPKLICPHGMQAKIITMSEDAARYTWQPDCVQGCP